MKIKKSITLEQSTINHIEQHAKALDLNFSESINHTIENYYNLHGCLEDILNQIESINEADGSIGSKYAKLTGFIQGVYKYAETNL